MPPSPPLIGTEGEELEAAQPCSIECLPNGLLSQIMALVGREHGGSLALVSRRWHGLVYAEPALWRTFQLRGCFHARSMEECEAWQAPQVAHLERMAAHVTSFIWQHDDFTGHFLQADLARCLAALQPAQLAELQLWGSLGMQGPTFAALRQLTGVTSLVLNFHESDPILLALAALGRQLRSLQLTVQAAPHILVGSIAKLTQLTALGMRAAQWPPLAPLTRLRCLKQLVVVESEMAHSMTQLPPPASFPAGLERFSFESENLHLKIGDCRLGKCRLWQGSTRELAVLSYDEQLPAELALPTLRLEVDEGMPNLAGCSGTTGCPFQRLELQHCLPTASALGDCSQLEQLRELAFMDTYASSGGDSLDVVMVMLMFYDATQLRSLAISGSTEPQRKVPDLLGIYRGLTSISLVEQGLTELGPISFEWQDLRSLDLSRNQFTCLPEAIRRATGLTSLSLKDKSQLALSEADRDTLLALPHLQQLNIESIKSADPALLADLQLRMPHLSIAASPPDQSA